MLRKIDELESLLPEKNKEIGKYAKHVIKALEDFEEHHRKLVAAQVLAGIKQDGQVEASFYETVHRIRREIVSTLEQTVEDLQHKGDKHYLKHFADGVE